MDDGPDQDPMVPSSRVIVVPSLLRVNAVGEHTGSGHDRNLVVSFGGKPPGYRAAYGFWRKGLEEEDEVEGEEEEEERERKWEGMVGNLKGGRKKKKKWRERGRGKEEEKEWRKKKKKEEEEITLSFGGRKGGRRLESREGEGEPKVGADLA
ncbi:hypothetical protein M5K25_027542 [Dendrobium thyrsiflorum]|uniref:Uncharacterized protein n=1 Tax=Dendrobium thyrsiflorum TaxID=117978 RepID=A0ABD0TU33_DENTH